MVSLVLLTTEEVLQNNKFWISLDTFWITEDLEPFHEVKPEYAYVKPLSRDYYYSIYPDIPRSESEDDNPMTIKGFIHKHQEWKAKINIKSFEAKRRSSNCSVKSTNSNGSVNNVTRKITSLVENCTSKEEKVKDDDERVRAFFSKLLESIPPPPLEDLPLEADGHSLIAPEPQTELNEIDLPNYEDFEKEGLKQNPTKDSLPRMSTLKRKKRVSFNTVSLINVEYHETWNESIYGISDFIDNGYEEHNLREADDPEIDVEEFIVNDSNASEVLASWTEIVNSISISNTIFRSKESEYKADHLISRSHCNDSVIISDLFQEDDDDETEYARFAVYKIYRTLKIEDEMKDSSSMKDFGSDNNEINLNSNVNVNSSFYKSMYCLSPKVDNSV